MVSRYDDSWINTYRYVLQLWTSMTHALSAISILFLISLHSWCTVRVQLHTQDFSFPLIRKREREREEEREWQRVIEISHTCNFVRFNWNAADVADCPTMRAKSFPSWLPDDELFPACRVTRRSFHFGPQVPMKKIPQWTFLPSLRF